MREVGVIAAIDRGFSVVLQALVLLTSAVITLALAALVVCRYFFGISLIGMHEASLLAAIWLYMCGAILASRRGEHLVVDMLANALPDARARNWHALLIALLTLGIAGCFGFWVWRMLAWGMQRPQSIPVLNLPLWVAQAPLALTALAAIAYALRDTLRAGTALANWKEEH